MLAVNRDYQPHTISFTPTRLLKTLVENFHFLLPTTPVLIFLMFGFFFLYITKLMQYVCQNRNMLYLQDVISMIEGTLEKSNIRTAKNSMYKSSIQTGRIFII
jgi:hypothetical protein